jgi:hypothetical protein
MKLVNLELLLPEDIPAGEEVRWFGRPDAISLARRAFRADVIAIYFIAMASWNFASAAMDHGAAIGMLSAAKTLAAGALGLAIIYFLSWLSARTTLYVVTNKRLVMKIGIALPVFFNIPFKSITSASVRTYNDGTGDIPVALAAPQRIAYLHLWPHARPFHFKQPEPSLRCVPDAGKVAALLAEALCAESEQVRSASQQAGVSSSSNAYADFPKDAATAA